VHALPLPQGVHHEVHPLRMPSRSRLWTSSADGPRALAPSVCEATVGEGDARAPDPATRATGPAT
jgi:hypothetical protein